MNLYGIVGSAGSGKDTVANYLCEKYNYKKLSFAGPIKDVLSILFGWDRKLLEGDTVNSRIWREEVDVWWAKKLNILNFTPRWAMQHIGTEVIRKYFNDEMWILIIESQMLTFDVDDNIIISDCRHPKEFDLIFRYNGKLIKVVRNTTANAWDKLAEFQNRADEVTLKQMYDEKRTMEHLFPYVHNSEWAWIGRPVSKEIPNFGSVEQLHCEIDNFLFSEFANPKNQQ
jgi:adenylate kinase family enzyme